VLITTTSITVLGVVETLLIEEYTVNANAINMYSRLRLRYRKQKRRKLLEDFPNWLTLSLHRTEIEVCFEEHDYYYYYSRRRARISSNISELLPERY
jgi:hypothetical protein